MKRSSLRETIAEAIQEHEGSDVEIRDLKVSYTKVAVVEEHEEITIGGEEGKPKKRGRKPAGEKPAGEKGGLKKKGHRGRKKGSKNKPKVNDDSEENRPLLG